MKFLPNGTSLEKATIPSYNESLEPTSLFLADRMVVINKDAGVIDAYDGSVEFFGDEVSTFIHFEKGRYFQKRALVHSDRPVEVLQPQFRITGEGAYYDLSTRQVFLTGKTESKFIREEVAQNFIKSAVLMTAELSEKDFTLSTEEKVKLAQQEEVGLQAAKAVEAEAKLNEGQYQNAQKKAQEGDKTMGAFLNKTGHKPKKVAAQKAADETPQVVGPMLKITNDGGTYVDTEKNLVVYLGNVQVDDPDFQLTCNESLKIFLSNKEGEKGKAGRQVDEILATGNVKVTYRKTGSKPPIIATGGSALVTIATEEMLIRGGLPKIRQGNNSSEAVEPGLWVKLKKSGPIWSKGAKKHVMIKE